jgi:glycosyltransferase involved in cell wall biosynthesis
MSSEPVHTAHPRQLNIAFLTNLLTNAGTSGGSVHVTQIGNRLIGRGHKLYTNLQKESARFEKLSKSDFLRRGREIDAFYIRIDGWPANDELTLLRQSNMHAPCIWEVNAPLEELRTRGVPEEEIFKKNERRKELAKMVDAAVCVSLEMEEYAKGFLEIKKTFVVQNGADPEMFTPAKREKDLYRQTGFKVLWSGSPEYSWQGLGMAQRLAEKLKVVDRSVLVVATAEGTSTENLLYLGSLPYSEMPRYMASADVGLCVYKEIDFFEKFFFSPLKLYDYMASGLPIIGSNVGQIKLMLEKYKNGVLTDATVDDLIEKVMYVKNNRSQAYEMGQNGRRAAVERHNWRNVVLRLEEIILSLIDERKSFAFNLGPGGISFPDKIMPAGDTVLNRAGRVSANTIISNLKSRGITEPLRRIFNKLKGQ